ncbi:hypothetical protein P154DRAFT_65978 [Amniculicola lignicola CBS 123094]|uniref:Uncharacterized protein n=1 Tax=Amniculicola lignicola CBS 123094 TaxID=1392246 RepID=A0A6A5X1I0_9PLEO|nr:hypothetical protein P154DRAFT_65978 [Amniculicola lignicola CBS 123094]
MIAWQSFSFALSPCTPVFSSAVESDCPFLIPWGALSRIFVCSPGTLAGCRGISSVTATSKLDRQTHHTPLIFTCFGFHLLRLILAVVSFVSIS